MRPCRRWEWSVLRTLSLAMCLATAWPLPLGPPNATARCDGTGDAEGERIVHLQTAQGAFLGITWHDMEGQTAPQLEVEEGCCPPHTRFIFRPWQGRHVLQSTSGLCLGLRAGVPVLGSLQELADDELVEVLEDLIASRSVSLCAGPENSRQVLAVADGRVHAVSAAVAGVDSVLLVVDEPLVRQLLHLESEGYAVVPVLSVEEAREARDILDGLVAAGTAQGLFYSNGYQVRVPDVARHDALFADLLVHPAVLFLVRQYLGKGARAATWSSNTLLPHMDHPMLGWHADYPYHDIEPGSWPDLPLGVQVLWMLDPFTKENGGTMFFPGSHLTMNPPIFDDFDEPEGAQILSAQAGAVLVAHSAWWHRQTANRSPRPRHALLACFTRGYVVPKADMEGQFHAISGAGGFWDRLDVRQQGELTRVMLGPHGRGLRGVHV